MSDITKHRGTKFYGNKSTKVFHTNASNDSCRQSEIKSSNRVSLQTINEAELAGFRKCKQCFKVIKKNY